MMGNKKFWQVEVDDEMKDIEQKILKILPNQKEKAMAIMIHLTSILKEEFGIDDELIIDNKKGGP